MTPSYPELKTEENVRDLLEKYKTPSRVAAELNCAEKTVRYAMKKHGIKQERLIPPTWLKNKLNMK